MIFHAATQSILFSHAHKARLVQNQIHCGHEEAWIPGFRMPCLLQGDCAGNGTAAGVLLSLQIL